MKRLLCLCYCICSLYCSAYAQEWSERDSIRLQKILQSEGEIQLNRSALKELEENFTIGAPIIHKSKSWMEFNDSLPFSPKKKDPNIKLSLRPYTPTTRYNWDPVYQRKIDIDAPPLMTLPFIYSNWAKHPLDAGPRETLEQIEATGMRYRLTDKFNASPGGWQKASGGSLSGINLMEIFTKEFWRPKIKKHRRETIEALRQYGDSISAREKVIR